MTREEAIQELQNCKGLIQQDGQDYLDERDIPLLDMAIEALSADDVQGEWEHWGSPFSDENEIIDTIVCSVCGARFIEPKDEPKGEYNYCPNCGARMKGTKK